MAWDDEFKMEVGGLDELAEKLDNIPAKFAKRIQRTALKAGAGVIAADMRSRCPVSPKAAHKDSEPGELRDSIGVTTKIDKDLGSSVAQVGPQYTKGLHEDTTHDPGVYGAFVEWGTKKMAPEPFARPAYEATKETAVEAYCKTAESLLDLLVDDTKE